MTAQVHKLSRDSSLAARAADHTHHDASPCGVAAENLLEIEDGVFSARSEHRTLRNIKTMA